MFGRFWAQNGAKRRFWPLWLLEAPGGPENVFLTFWDLLSPLARVCGPGRVRALSPRSADTLRSICARGAAFLAVFAAYPALSSPDSAPSGPWPAQPARPAHEPRGPESVIFDVLGPCFGPQRVGAAGAGAPDLARGARTHRTPFPRRLRAVIRILVAFDPRTRRQRPLGGLGRSSSYWALWLQEAQNP